MEPFPELTGLESFPGHESSTLEFKETLTKCGNEKIHATVCAFLNNKGGYLVFGVTDTGLIKGLRVQGKDLDAQLLRLDNMYHLKMITHENGDAITTGVITCSVVTAGEGKRVLVVAARPEPGQRYKLRDGSMWYRLSASNYRVQDTSYAEDMQRLSAELEIARKMAETAKFAAENAKQERNNLLAELKNERRRATAAVEQLNKLRVDAAALLEGARKADEDLAGVMRMLETDILLRKEEAEAAQATALKVSWWTFLRCGLF